MEENIIGGVSPLKAKKMRRGKSYGKGKRGTGDTRYKRDKWVKPASGGTTTKAPKAPNPTKPYVIKDGKVEMTPPGDIYNYGDNIITQTSDGGYTDETIITPGTDKTDDVWGTRMVTKTKDYSKDWKGPKSDKYPDGMPYDIWIKQKGNKEKEDKFVKSQQYQEEEKYLISKGQKGTKGSKTSKRTYVPGASLTATIDNPINMLGSPGKYRLGGYRAMKKNRK